jgi:hypothetical protein
MNKGIEMLRRFAKLQRVLNTISLVYSLNGKYYEINEGIEIPEHEVENRSNLLYLGEGIIKPMV